MSETAIETGLFLDGLRCAGCVNRVERALLALPGVEEASINYTNHRARVRFDAERTSAAGLVDCVAGLGYEATPYDPTALDRPAERSARDALVRVLVAAFLAGNVMWLAIALYIGAFEGIDETTRSGLRWVATALSLPAVTWCAAPFWRGAFAGLRRWEITIDVPVVLGLSVAFGVSIVGTATNADHVYVDSAAMIVFLILLGRTLERRARARTSESVERLSRLAPKTAWRRSATGLEEIPLDQVAVGDRLVIPPGEAVPADGRMVAGASEFDESLLSGESVPVAREPGDAVAGGSRNLLCEVSVSVTATAREGTLARLQALLERAQMEKPALQRLADRVAAVFAPTVLALAALVAAYWTLRGAPALEVALTTAAVLIVACPCALGLATPAAVTAALGRAARLGILFKSGDAIERCARVDRILIDKTGTLTEGCQHVDAVVTAPGVDAKQLLAAAADAEGASLHPVAAGIRRAAAEAGAIPNEPTPRETIAGRGVRAGQGPERILVGNAALLRDHGLEPAAALVKDLATRAAEGATVAWVAHGDRVLGAITLTDRPREDAAQAVARLERLGLAVSLLSGDHEAAVRLAAGRAGIASAAAEITPEGKLHAVRRCREAGETVLAAGDGVNDAACLAAADVGASMARGADVAIHASDLVIRSPRLSALPDAPYQSFVLSTRLSHQLLRGVPKQHQKPIMASW